MSITLHPSDGIVISKKWLEGEIARLSNLKPDEVRFPQKVYTQLHLLTHILQFRSQPLKPVLEVAWDTAAGQWNKFPDVLPAVGSECVVITKNGTTYTSIFKDGLYWTSVKKSYDVEYWAVINKPK